MDHSPENSTLPQSFFSSRDIDLFYQRVLGEHSHCGIFKHPDEDLQPAKERTTEYMASLFPFTSTSRVVDLGAGYGGSARYLAQIYGCTVSCLNLSDLQNNANKNRNRAAQLDNLVQVYQGQFERLPFPDESFEVAWSQDAFYYSENQLQAIREAHRVLESGGELLLSNYFLHSDHPTPEEREKAVDLYTSGTHTVYFHPLKQYQTSIVDLGMETVQFIDLTENVSINFLQDIKKMEAIQTREQLWSKSFFEQKIQRLRRCSELGESGLIKWGILHCRKP